MLGTSEGKANELEGQRNTLVIKRKHTKSRLKMEQNWDRGGELRNIAPCKANNFSSLYVEFISGFQFWAEVREKPSSLALLKLGRKENNRVGWAGKRRWDLKPSNIGW